MLLFDVDPPSRPGPDDCGIAVLAALVRAAVEESAEIKADDRNLEVLGAGGGITSQWHGNFCAHCR